MAAELLFDSRHDRVDRRRRRGGRARPARCRPAAWPVERLDVAPTLAHEQRRVLDPFVGGEATTAGQALPPAPDRARLVGEARVDDLVVVRPAVRTAHEPTVIRSVPNARHEIGALRDQGVGTVSRWPGITVSVPSASHHGVDDGPDVVAGRERARRSTTACRRAARRTCCTCGRRPGVARDDPPSAAARTRDRQHEAQADQRGENAPAAIDGALMAARRPGAGLTVGLGQP